MRLSSIGAVLALLAAAATPAALRAQARNPHRELNGAECFSCHVTSNWRDVRYDHRQAGFDLRGRHVIVPCSGCHDVRDFRTAVKQCAVCHQDPHRGDAGANCQQCHNEAGWRYVNVMNAHAGSRLPDLGAHFALRCDDCHRQTGDQMFHGALQRCLGCHQTTYAATTNPSHVTLGFPPSCEQCHQMATWNFALYNQHDAIFGIYSGAHAGAWQSCASCHPVQADYTKFVCITCHTQPVSDPLHASVPGYQYQDVSCLSCHPGGKPGDAAFHEAIFPLTTGKHIAGVWNACSDCHTDPTNRQVVTCVTAACHPQPATDGTHSGMTGYSYATAQCLSCHPTGGPASGGNFHETFFPIAAGTHAGKWAACADCHTDPTNRKAITCMSGSCHAQTLTGTLHNRIPGYSYTGAGCFSCHPTGAAGTFPQHDLVFPINSGAHAGLWGTNCATCHPNDASHDHSTWTCVGGGCHAQAPTDATHSKITGYSYASGPCLTCHPSGTGGVFPGHDAIFPITTGKHTRILCNTCHQTPGDRSIWTCMASGCHPQAETNSHHQGQSGYSYTALACYTCHPSGRSGAPMPVPLTSPRRRLRIP
jgi:hypothetical protein